MSQGESPLTFLGFDKKDWIHKESLVNEDKEKIQCLTNALFADPNDGNIWHELGDKYADFDQEKAQHCWSNASKSYLNRLEKFKDDAKKYSKNSSHLLFMDVYSSDIIQVIASMYFSLGSIYINLEKYSLAVDAYKTSYSLKDNSDCLYFAASALYDLNQFEKAKKIISKNIELTDKYQSHYLLGIIHVKNNEIFLAQQSFWNCIYNAGKDAQSCHYKYLAYEMLGNYKMAEFYLKKALKIEPKNQQRMLNLIEYYEETGKHNKTQKYYDKLHMLHRQTKEQKRTLKNE